MAKKTLLQIVQSTMVSMNRADVSSIFDLEESEQVAEIARDVFEQIALENDWAYYEQVIQLGSVADNTKPNYLLLPESLVECKLIKYNVRRSTDTNDQIREIPWVHPREFLSITQSRNSSATNTTEVTDFSGAKYQILNDAPPQYWTSFDDRYVAFDAYDSVVDDCLQASKSTALVTTEPTFTLEDSHVPDMPAKLFPYYLARVKESARAYLHGEIVPIDPKVAMEHKANLFRTESRSNVRKRINNGRK